MGFVADAAESVLGGITGETGAEASLEGARIQQEAIDKGLSLIDPFGAIGEQGLGQASFLTDPQEQFDFLKDNPLFKPSGR